MSSSKTLPIRPQDNSSEGYSHDATLAAIKSVFEYISEVYGEGYELSYPPPGGWEGVNRHNLRIFQDHGFYRNGLTDRALKLIRHMPYFLDDRPELMYHTEPPWHHERFCDPNLKPPTELEKQNARNDKAVSWCSYDPWLPPQFVTLTYGNPGKGYTIIVDTDQGIVRWWDLFDGQEFPTDVGPDLAGEYDAEEIDQNGPEGWKLAPRYRISTFFDLWRKEFLDWNKELMYREDEEGEEEEEGEEREEKGEESDDDEDYSGSQETNDVTDEEANKQQSKGDTDGNRDGK